MKWDQVRGVGNKTAHRSFQRPQGGRKCCVRGRLCWGLDSPAPSPCPRPPPMEVTAVPFPLLGVAPQEPRVPSEAAAGWGS